MDDLEDEAWKVSFGVSKSTRYHMSRRAFFLRIDRANKILILLLGCVIAYALGAKYEALDRVVALTLAALAVLDIVIGWDAKARAHDSLYRQYSGLQADIVTTVTPRASDIARWGAERLQIEADEPGVMDWLEKHCAYLEAKARGVEPAEDAILPRWKIMLAQIVP